MDEVVFRGGGGIIDEGCRGAGGAIPNDDEGAAPVAVFCGDASGFVGGTGSSCGAAAGATTGGSVYSSASRKPRRLRLGGCSCSCS